MSEQKLIIDTLYANDQKTHTFNMDIGYIDYN